MGITGLIPFLEKGNASRRANVDEFSGCTVAIDSYCWLHKGAFACADKLVRGEDTDVHIKYCLKYVTMLLSKNIKPILVFDGRHLPAKALTETRRRESRNVARNRAAELLALGKVVEARSYMRRSVDVTHNMALDLIKECRKRNVDCIVAPYEADAQLAYLNTKNIAQLVITEDSDLILFGCTKVLFKMDLEGMGTLVDTAKLPLVMKCPVEQYTFDKFRQMCIMSGCDYLPSLPGIGLVKAQQFINATQDPNIANALRKLPSYFNKSSLVVTDEYRESFLKAEATFKHQYVYDPIERKMVRLTEPDDEDIETALCVNAGELLDEKTAFQLALGNIDPFTLKVMDSWHPDHKPENDKTKTDSWQDVANHPSMWYREYSKYLTEQRPWQKKVQKVEPIFGALQTRIAKKVVNLVPKYVAETQDESLTIENLSSMYCVEPATKKAKMDNSQIDTEKHNIALTDSEITKEISTVESKSPILENKERSYRKCVKNNNILKRLSKFTRTVLDEENVVESKFFSPNVATENSNDSNTSADKSITIEESPEKMSNNPFKVRSISEINQLVKPTNEQTTNDHDTSRTSITIEESPEKVSKNPFKVRTISEINQSIDNKISNSPDEIHTGMQIDTECIEILDSQESSQKENNLSPILESGLKLKGSRLHSDVLRSLSEDSVIDNTYPLEVLVTPVDTQLSYGESQEPFVWNKPKPSSQPIGVKKSTCRVPGLRRTTSLPSNQPTLLSKFGFQKKPILKR